MTEPVVLNEFNQLLFYFKLVNDPGELHLGKDNLVCYSAIKKVSLAPIIFP